MIFGIVKFGETIAKFATRDVKLKPLCDLWALVVGTGQRRNFGGVFHDERGFPQFFFHGFFEVEHLQTGQSFLGQIVLGFAHAQLLQGLNEPSGVVHFVASFGVFDDGFTNGEASKRLGQINGLARI